MMFLQEFLPVVIYFLLIILIVVGIILGVKAIQAIGKVNGVLDDVNQKLGSFNRFFDIMDFATDKIVAFSDKIVDIIINFFTRIFSKNKNNKEDENIKQKGNEENE